jgi:hypothetical protein
MPGRRAHPTFRPYETQLGGGKGKQEVRTEILAAHRKIAARKPPPVQSFASLLEFF